MQTLAMIGQFLLALSILVGLHEFGHFAAAKFFYCSHGMLMAVK